MALALRFSIARGARANSSDILKELEKSNKNKGGQFGHKGTTLTKEKIDKMIENNEIYKIITVEENKTKLTENNTPIVTYEVDIKIEKILIKHIYYLDVPKLLFQIQ